MGALKKWVLRVRLNGNNLRVGREFVYPRSTISAGSVMQMELNHRLNEKARMMERLGCIWRNRSLSTDTKNQSIGYQCNIISTTRFNMKYIQRNLEVYDLPEREKDMETSVAQWKENQSTQKWFKQNILI